MRKMSNWQRIWNDDGNTGYYSPVRIIASVLSFFYLGVVNFRNRLYDHKILKEVKLACPVISVGNITVGGTGKTPCVIMLAQMLQTKGFKPAIISRGYGAKKVNSVNIVSDGKRILMDSDSAGDEPFLMAQKLNNVPVITGAKRVETGMAAIRQFGANVLICDDAMQHRQIFRDINLVLLDSGILQGNRHVLPRGRLREPLKELKRADAILITRADELRKNKEIEDLIEGKSIPVFRSIHKPKDIITGDYGLTEPISGIKGKKVSAFCGIANPDSFKKTLQDAGAEMVSFNYFPDHHLYRKSELEGIKKEFIDCRADYLMTTEKDAMRLQSSPEFLKILTVLRVEMEIRPSSEAFEKYILEKIKSVQIKSTG